MNQLFNLFDVRLRLTEKQEKDAKTKYDWVCEVLHTSFYPTTKYDWKTKYLFWSYKKKTNIRPIIPEQDVDVLFKIPSNSFDDYKSQKYWPSNLLQKVKELLKDKYTTTEKIKPWWKVVLVQFKEWTHNVELLPAFENTDLSFTIPNTENWWSWENFNPREEVSLFQASNVKYNWLTAKLSRFLKSWKRQNSWLNIKSYQIENYVVEFLDWYNSNDNILMVIKDLFDFIYKSENNTYIETAIKRIQKSIDFNNQNKYESSVWELKKVFWDIFPSISSLSKSFTDFNEWEKNIEDLCEVKLNTLYEIKIDCEVKQNWFREWYLSYFISMKYPLQKQKQLTFFIKESNIPKPYSIKWKIRNFWIEAEENNDLRWEIVDDSWNEQKIENTKYKWEHFVECYIIKDNVCVARDKIIVPI